MNAPTTLPTVYSMSDLEKMAAQMVKSKLFGVQNVEQAVTLMLLAQSEGLHPATAARDYHIISGRPSMKADTMLSRFQSSGGVVEWQDYSDTKVAATFKHPQSPKPVLIEWTFEQANKIGLTGKDNWRNYPRAMLRARVISEGVRTCYPVVSAGIYTPEEVTDMGRVKDITPTAGYFKALPAKRQEIVSDTALLIQEHMDNDRPLDALGLVDDPALDAEEKIALWSLLPSDHRSALKRLHDAERSRTAGTITPAQKKRLEARIGELGLDREGIKRHCADRYGAAHFTALTVDQYQELDAWLDSQASGKTTESAGPQAPDAATADREASGEARRTDRSPTGTLGQPATPADYLTPDQQLEIADDCRKLGSGAIEALLKRAGVASLALVPATKLESCRNWIASKKVPA